MLLNADCWSLLETDFCVCHHHHYLRACQRAPSLNFLPLLLVFFFRQRFSFFFPHSSWYHLLCSVLFISLALNHHAQRFSFWLEWRGCIQQLRNGWPTVWRCRPVTTSHPKRVILANSFSHSFWIGFSGGKNCHPQKWQAIYHFLNPPPPLFFLFFAKNKNGGRGDLIDQSKWKERIPFIYREWLDLGSRSSIESREGAAKSDWLYLWK